MKQEIQIYCKNSQKTKSFPIGSSLFEIYKGFDLQMPYGVVSAKVNNHVEGLLVHTNRSCKLWSGFMPEMSRQIGEACGIKFVVTVSADPESATDVMRKFM